MTSIEYFDFQADKETSRLQRYEMERLTAERDAWKQACHNKDKLLAIISHDIKGQLGGLNGLINILALENEQPSSSEFQNYVNLLQQSSSNLFQLLENLLQWARLQTWKIEAQNQKGSLYLALHEIFELNKNAVRAKRITYTLDCPMDLHAETDFNLMSFIVRNLIANAIKYTPEGGEIHVKASKEDDQTILINVSDTGKGIPPEVQSKLFDPQAMISTAGTANEKGTGLGLLLCLEFAQMLESSLNIHSIPDKGTSCSFFVKAMPVFEA